MINELSTWMLVVIAINLGIAVLAISSFRYLLGLLAGANTTLELSQKDNYAFGLVFAGGSTALGLVLAAAIAGDAEANYLDEALNVLTYAVAGLVLLKVGALINDLVMFHKVPLKEAVANHNISAAIVQAANLVALGIVIYSAINWVESESWEGLLAVFSVFFAAQLVLLVVTRIRIFIYGRRHDGGSLQIAIVEGNPALAIRYAGHIIGSSLAIGSAAYLVEYVDGAVINSAIAWGGVALCLAMMLSALSFISRLAILANIDVVEEVDEQQNVGIAFIEAAIFVVIGLLLGSVVA